MMDKQKQIEEMAKTINDVLGTIGHCPFDAKCPYLGTEHTIDCDECMTANTMYEAGYRKITDDVVVMAKEYYEEFQKQLKELEELL